MECETCSSAAVRVFINREWLETGERFLPLARYLFGQKEHSLPTFRDQFAHNMEFKSVYLSDSAECCDFMFLPVNYCADIAANYPKLIERMEMTSTKLGKTMVVEAHSQDVANPAALNFPFSNGLYFNSALIRSLAPKNFNALPYFVPDCLQRYYGGRLTLLGKEAVPSVGFCGVAAPLRTPFSSTKLLDGLRLALSFVDDFGLDAEAIARRWGTNMKHAHRTRALLRLRRSELVKADFVLRPVGGLVNKNYTNIDDMDPYNTEFYDNLHRNLYSLCSRGTENYSVRFYETFCMGRIPILIDTNVVLPFDSRIDYEKHCVIVKKHQLARLPELIARFHSSRSESEIAALQQSNRKLWETHLSPDAFWVELAREISDAREVH
jgi:hypothetical protein